MIYAGRFVAQHMRRSFTTVPFLDRTKQLLDEAVKSSKKTEEVAKAWLAKDNDDKLPKDGVYKHPYCTVDFPLAMHFDHLYRLVLKSAGPEPVSPHFDSIEEFGKWFNYFFIFFGFCTVLKSHHNHAFGYVVTDMLFGMEVWVYTIAIYVMRCSVMIAPNPWKTLWENYNMDSMLGSVYEVEENLAFSRKKEPIQQHDYLRLHNEYVGTKALLLERHLQTSRILLKKNTYERTLAALKSIDRFEKDNLNSVLRDALDSAVSKMVSDLEADKSGEIKKQAFQSAITGIKKGKMSYEGDPLLPRVIKYIDEFKAKAEKLTAQEIAGLVGLKADQREALKSNDKKLEEYFLKALPAIKHPKVVETAKFKSLSA